MVAETFPKPTLILQNSFPFAHSILYLWILQSLFVLALCFLLYPLSSAMSLIKALLSSSAQLLFDSPCQFSPELIKLPHSFFSSQAFVLPMQKAFPLTVRFPLDPWADKVFYLTNNPSCSAPKDILTNTANNSILSCMNPLKVAVQIVLRVQVTYGFADTHLWNTASWCW